MKIIDFEKRGNVIRFYFGKDDCEDYWGDDWNDRPYEHNAERVYSEYIEEYIDVAVDMDYHVMEPADDWRYNNNTPFSKEDMKKRSVPCIIVVPNDDSYASEEFNRYAVSDNVDKIYFGDSIEKLNKYTILKRGKL